MAVVYPFFVSENDGKRPKNCDILAELPEPAGLEERVMAVAYTDLAASTLRALDAEGASELRGKAMACLNDAYRAAHPKHHTQSPSELLLQVQPSLAKLLHACAHCTNM